jgi:hypothetical protein
MTLYSLWNSSHGFVASFLILPIKDENNCVSYQPKKLKMLKPHKNEMKNKFFIHMFIHFSKFLKPTIIGWDGCYIPTKMIITTFSLTQTDESLISCHLAFYIVNMSWM